jgi:hypothetical protein
MIKRCRGDCAGLPPDGLMAVPVIYGPVEPSVAFVCVAPALTAGAQVVEARKGIVLSPVDIDGGAQRRGAIAVLQFTEDGHKVAEQPSPSPRSAVDACHAAGVPQEAEHQA